MTDEIKPEKPWFPFSGEGENAAEGGGNSRTKRFSSVAGEAGYTFPRYADRVYRDPNPGYNSRQEEMDRRKAKLEAKKAEYAPTKADNEQARRERAADARRISRAAAKAALLPGESAPKQPRKPKAAVAPEPVKNEPEVRLMSDTEFEAAQTKILPEEERVSNKDLYENPWKNRRESTENFPQGNAVVGAPKRDVYRGRGFFRVTVTNPAGGQISRPMTATEHIAHHTSKADEAMQQNNVSQAAGHWAASDFWEKELDAGNDNWYENVPDLQSGSVG